MAQFIFVRHGESEANAMTIIANADSPLTPKGMEQARQTAAAVRQFGIIHIICSPYTRVRQTAEIIARELGIDTKSILVIDDLRERGLGEFEGKTREHDSTWYYTIDNMAHVEPRADLLARITRALKQIKTSAHQETVLVVGHALSGFYLRQVAIGHTRLEDFDPPNQLGNAKYIELPL